MTPNPRWKRSCAFCGHENITVNTKTPGTHEVSKRRREGKDTSNYLCRCTKCGAKGPLKHSEDEAITAWNKRVYTEHTTK